MNKKCLNIFCEKSSISRGLCGSCYEAVKRLIRKEKISAKEAEEQGIILPRRRGGPKNKEILDWLNRNKQQVQSGVANGI